MPIFLYLWIYQYTVFQTCVVPVFSVISEQQNDPDLDIVTGFQLLDGVMHLFVLEGLADKAIKVIWESLPKPEHSGTYWYTVHTAIFCIS